MRKKIDEFQLWENDEVFTIIDFGEFYYHSDVINSDFVQEIFRTTGNQSSRYGKWRNVADFESVWHRDWPVPKVADVRQSKVADRWIVGGHKNWVADVVLNHSICQWTVRNWAVLMWTAMLKKNWKLWKIEMTGFCPVSGPSFTSVEGYFQRVSKLTGFITGIIPAVCKLVCFIDYYGMFL